MNEKETAYSPVYPGKVHFELKGSIAVLTLDDPSTLNSLSLEMLASINLLFDKMAEDDNIRAVIITGEGRSFIAGANLKNARVTDPSKITGPERREELLYIHRTLNKIADFPRPTIAAINGYALGGGAELSLCCDFRFASTKAKIGFPETRLGGMPAYTGPTRAVRIIGVTAAKEMIYTAKNYTAEEAMKLGFVSRVFEPDRLMDGCMEFLNDIVSRAPLAVKYSKMMLNRTAEMSVDASLEMERMITGILGSTYDWGEGMKAFAEKRTPEFQNK